MLEIKNKLGKYENVSTLTWGTNWLSMRQTYIAANHWVIKKKP